MEHMFYPEEAQRVAEARMSFAGLPLTDRQFNDVIAITGIIERRIEETGSFFDLLNDQAHTFARNERIRLDKAPSIIRDIFKLRTGATMNEMREGLLAREAVLFDRENNPAEAVRQKAYQAASEAAKLVETGTKINFFRALNHESVQLARDLDITHVGAKKLIEESFEEIEGRKLMEWGKELDEKYYRPQIEAEKKQRAAGKNQSRKQQPSYS